MISHFLRFEDWLKQTRQNGSQSSVPKAIERIVCSTFESLNSFMGEYLS